MDSLENEQHKSRLQLFFMISLGAYFFWFSQMTPPAVQQPVVSNEVEEGEELSNEVKPDNSTVSKPSVSEKTVVQPHSVTVNEGLLDFEVSSKYGSPTFVGLTNFTEPPVNQSWWGWIFSGMEGEWIPYSEGEDELKLLTEQGALLVLGKDEQTFQDIFTVTRSGDVVQAKGQVNGLTIQQTYEISKDSNSVEDNIISVSINISNHSSDKIDNLWVGVYDYMNSENQDRFSNASRPQFYAEKELVGTFGTMFTTSFLDLDDLEEPTTFESEADWFGIGSKYFLTALYPVETGTFKSVSTHILEENVYGVRSVLAQPIDPGATRIINLKAYVGPKQLDLLTELSEGEVWTSAVEYGMFGFFSRVLLFMLKIIQSGFVNWGLSILLLTLVVKVIFFPLTQKAFISSKKMQLAQPRMKEVQQQYKDNPQLLQQEMMKVYKEFDMGPLGPLSGCLPMFIQMPVFFALYSVVLFSVELYDSSFLYLEDLTTADPYGILAVLYCVLIFIQTSMMTTTPENADPQQQQMMKMMKIMPLVFGVLMFTFPSGLVLYFVMNILLTIFQQWLIRFQFDETTLLKEAK